MQLSEIEVLFQGNNLARLFQALILVIKISFLSLLLGLFLGIVIGILRTLPNKILRFFLRIYLEIFRIVPLLVLLFIFYYILPEQTNSNISGFSVSILVFVLWISAEVSEITRSAIVSIPKIQIESALTIGFRRTQIYYFVLLPQAFRSALPQVVNLVTRVIKSSSILMMIGVVELLKVGTQIIENYSIKVPSVPIVIYTFILILYFLLCYPLSILAEKLEKHLAT